MEPRASAFRRYLESLPDDLLESVTEDYIWLAGLDFEGAEGDPGSEFRRRRECCHEECERRGVPQLYVMAGKLIA